ncbi:MAG: NAD-dependent epimerase/dehydratase family protein [Candidatus Sericytochromatia bacterium]|nr:NAD-dependent epimerase/dehydratase family protein [Candidatus Sericytochromatia bacterium]
MKTVLVTGASGCVGHRVVKALLDSSGWRVRALVREPRRLSVAGPPERLHAVAGDVAALAEGAAVHADVDAIIHLATAWGDPIAYPVNVDATVALARLGVPMVHVATASVADGRGGLAPAAFTHGTDYIVSKALAVQRLAEQGLRRHVTVLYPTLVVAGTRGGPPSHVGRALAQAGPWLRWLRHVRAEGRFLLIHAEDVARVALAALEAPAPGADWVVGNAPVTVAEALAELCAVHGLRYTGRLDAEPLVRLAPRLAGRRMTSWDRHCLTHRDHALPAVNPRALGLAPGRETLAAMAAFEGWGGARKGMVGGGLA